MDAGVVRLALTNYTGVLFLSQTAPDGPGDSAAVLSAVEEARGAKRRGRDCPPQTPDPADARTIKKPKGLKADDDEGAWDGVDDEAGSGRSADLRLESLAHVYEQLDAAASSELVVDGGVEAERGVFALLGNGKNPGKTGAVVVSASGYDPGLKRPEDLTGGSYPPPPPLPPRSSPALAPARAQSHSTLDSAFVVRGARPCGLL